MIILRSLHVEWWRLPNPGDKLPEEVKILEFDTHSLEWLNFVTACRLGQAYDVDWDLVIGGVANDKAFDVFYKSNLYTEIRFGISDMHCRSDGYLAEELSLELERAKDNTLP